VVVPSHDPEVVRQLGWIPEAAFAEGLQFVAADGRNWQGAAAVERIISDLASDAWAWGALEGALRLPGARPLLRLGYDTFARHRCRLGCG
jgi:predicted DCC family thiol-disulfide oxidoreductase YuxK